MPDSIKPTDIIMGDRFRVDLGDIEDLAASLRRFGLIQPLVVDRSLNLIAGGRRLTAALSIGLDLVPIIYRDEVDELTLRELELEENVKRKDLEWHEKAQLTGEIHRLKQLKYGAQATGRPAADQPEGWGMRDTARTMERALSVVSVDIALDRLIKIMPELRNETSVQNALKAVDKTIERLERERAVRQARKRAESIGEGLDTIWLGDSLDLIRRVPPDSVDCVIIDPPYGTEAQGNIHFDDTPEHALALLRCLLPELRRVSKKGAHLWCFFGIKLWVETISLFNEMGFPSDPIPAVWVKDTEGLVDFSKRLSHSWEPILFCGGDGSRSLSYKRNNVFQFAAPRDRANTAEKPAALVAELIKLSTREGEIVLDCFSGSGVVACEAKRAGRHFIAMEQDRNQWNESIIRLVDIERAAQGAETEETDESRELDI